MATMRLDSWQSLASAGIPMEVTRGPMLFGGITYQRGDRFPALNATPPDPMRMRQLYEQRRISPVKVDLSAAVPQVGSSSTEQLPTGGKKKNWAARTDPAKTELAKAV